MEAYPEKERQKNTDRTEMTTMEVLKLQMDNTQHEIQQLQVDNQKLWAEVQLGEAKLAEIGHTQRLLNSEEVVNGAQQEAEQWKKETEIW